MNHKDTIDTSSTTETHPENEDDGGGSDTDEEFYSEMLEVSRPIIIITDGDKNNNNLHTCCTFSSEMMSMEAARSYAIQALALTVQEWNTIGQSSDPTVAETSIFGTTATTGRTTTTTTSSTNEARDQEEEAVILEQCVHRVTSLFLVRIVAIVLHRQQQLEQERPPMNGSSTIQQKKPKQIDLSTSGICRQILIVDNNNNNDDDDDYYHDQEHAPPPWSFLSNEIVQQLEQYVRYILCHYATSTQLPFHNRTHAVTVVTNCNKLIDFILDPNNYVNQNNNNNINKNEAQSYAYHEDNREYYNSQGNHHCHMTSQLQQQRPVITYGLRKDPLLVFALLFAALIHDVQHEGKLNSQLVVAAATKNTIQTSSPNSSSSPPPAALLYNDQSIQEMRSLRVAFEELLKDDYVDLRNILFQKCHSHTTPDTGDPQSSYRYFRNAVISAVLSTDLSSPERMAVSRSKWKEAFFVTPHGPQHHPNSRHVPPPKQQPLPPNHGTGGGKNHPHHHRRASAASQESKPRIIRPMSYHRRGSNYSEMSEITTDEGNEPFVISESVPQQLQLSSSIHIHRRNSVTSEISAGSYHQQQQLRRWQQNRGQYPSTSQYRQRRRSSVQSDVSSDCESSEVAVDSVALMYNKQNLQSNHYYYTARNAKDEASVDSIVSDTIDSYVLRTTKVVKVKREVELNKQISTKNEPDVMAATKKPLPNENIDIRSANSSMDHATPQRTLSAETDGSTSFVSYPTGSIAVIQKRLEGAPKTRRRATNKEATDDKNNNDDDDAGDNGEDVVEANRSIEEANLPDDTRNTKCALPLQQDQYLNTLNGELGHSFSPPSSDNDDDDLDDEYEKQRKELYSSPPSRQIIKPIFPSSNYQHNDTVDRSRNPGNCIGPARMITRRASTGAISRFGSLTDLRIDENHSNNGESNALYDDDNDYDDYYNTNHTTLKNVNVDLPEIPKYRKRLGIRRSMDLSGEAIEFYPRRTSIGNLSNFSGTEQQDGINNNDADDDEADFMKASAIIEALLRMADVGHFYQNWQNMTVWSARMFQERMHAEPSTAKQDEIYTNWFNNQILIIDSYLKPLAVQIDETGVLGECHGGMMVQNVEEIRRHWMIYGYEWSQKLIHDIEKP